MPRSTLWQIQHEVKKFCSVCTVFTDHLVRLLFREYNYRIVSNTANRLYRLHSEVFRLQFVRNYERTNFYFMLRRNHSQASKYHILERRTKLTLFKMNISYPILYRYIDSCTRSMCSETWARVTDSTRALELIDRTVIVLL